MSANGNGSDEARPGREVAHRLFAAEFDDASLSYAESDEERAPNYVISPTGARLNRVFVVGTLTEVTDVNEEMVRARVVDPTGAFVVYAGQYQPEALAFLERAEPPAFVAVTGKARTFEPDDGDQIYTSIRPESLATVDADTRDRWVVDTAEHTLNRIETYAAAAELDVRDAALTDVLQANGVSRGFAEGIPLAQSHYGTTPTYLSGLRTIATEAVRVVAGEQSQVESTVGSPDSTGPDGPDYASLVGDETVLSVPEGFEADTADDSAAVEPDAVEPETDDAAGAAVGTATATTTTEADGAAVDDAVRDSDGAAEEPSTTDGSTDTDDSAPESDGATAGGEPESDAVETDLEDDSADVSESDATTETTTNDESDDDDLGDFEPGDASGDDETGDVSETDGDTEEADGGAEEADDDAEEADVDADDFDDGMYELDEEEREQIEAEYGTDFTTGTEVDEPGEADIDVPDPEDVMPEDADESASDDAESDDEATDDDADVDLQARVVETMDELDDGDGADRSAVVDAVADETGADEDAIEQAIQDALMGGECFEPSDGRLQAI